MNRTQCPHCILALINRPYGLTTDRYTISLMQKQEITPHQMQKQTTTNAVD